MSQPLPSPEPASLDEQLVAYLDGELTPAEREQIEHLLASDPGVRRRLVELERSWELLDELDRPEPDDAFVRTTLEMAAVEAGDDLQATRSQLRALRRRRWLSGLLAAAGAGVAGFLLVAWLQPDPNAALLRDLPVLEHLDQYRAVGDIEFLELLRDRSPFQPAPGEEDRP